MQHFHDFWFAIIFLIWVARKERFTYTFFKEWGDGWGVKEWSDKEVDGSILTYNITLNTLTY